MKVITIMTMFVLIMFAFSPLTLAQENTTTDVEEVVIIDDEVELDEEEGITPDSFLYGLDNAMERISLALTFNKVKRAEKALRHAEERLAEERAMIKKGKIDKAEKARERHERDLERAQEAIDEIEIDGDEEKVREALAKIAEMKDKMKFHQAKVTAVKVRILERQADKMNEEQLARLEEVFAKIEKKAQEMDKKIAQKRENAKMRYKILSEMTDEEIEGFLKERKEMRKEIKEERVKERFRERINQEDFDEETKVKIDGDILLPPVAKEILVQLVSSLKGTEGKIELELKVKKQNGEVSIESDVEGNLNSEQQTLWDKLQDMAINLVENAERANLELEIEIEHELEIEESEEVEEETESEDDDDQPKEVTATATERIPTLV